MNQKGITLIALIMMIIILVILSAVIIRAVTNENLIGTTTNATENYKIAEYKEMISSEITSCIQNSMLRGETASLGDIANWLSEKTDWTKSATVYNDTSDILLTTTDGYVFQIYYNSAYGVFYVEYIGKGNEDEFPTLTASYTRSTQEITADVTGGAGRVDYIELYYKGEKIGEGDTSNHLSKKITAPGWYTIKTETSKHKIRYAYVRVETLDGSLRRPSINVTEGEAGTSDWYKSNVKVTISSNETDVNKIYYKTQDSTNITEGEGEFTAVDGKTTTFDVTTEGSTLITAYVASRRRRKC